MEINPKVAIFYYALNTDGGGNERVALEEEKYFNNRGFKTMLFTYYYNANIFSGVYDPSVSVILPKKLSKYFIIKSFQLVFSLRKAIKYYNPTHIICINPTDCIHLFLATICTSYKYSTHIPQTIFWDFIGYGDAYDNNNKYVLARYSRKYRKVYSIIRNATPGHIESLPEKPIKLTFRKKILSEIISFLDYHSVRRSSHIFTLSEKMQWEISQIYNKRSIVLKGAYSKYLLNYKKIFDIKSFHQIEGAQILFSLCHLTPKKRVDLIIRAFAFFLKENKTDNVILIIGGDGPSYKDLVALSESLNISQYVIFTGFIEEQKLHDYYYSCDIFISGDHADFDITTYMAICFNKKIIWSIENELGQDLLSYKNIFPAEITPESFAKQMNIAISSNLNTSFNKELFTWEHYFETIYSIINDNIS